MIKKTIAVVMFVSLFTQSCVIAKDLKNDVLNLAAMSVVIGATSWALYDYYKMSNSYERRKLDEYKYEKINSTPILQGIFDTYAPRNNEIQLYKLKQEKCSEALELGSFPRARAVFAYNQYSIDALLNQSHEKHLEARAVAGHEIGHILHFDVADCVKHKVIAGTSVATASLLSFEIVRENLWKVLLPLYVIKRTLDKIIFCAAVRYQERQADQHVINCSKNPAELREFASGLQHNSKVTQEDLSRSILFRTHPWSKDRIKKFEEAALILEKEQRFFQSVQIIEA
jgi:Zn-dependent protease with chaperone function